MPAYLYLAKAIGPCMIGAFNAFTTRPNFRRKQSGWEKRRDKQLISTQSLEAIMHHRDAVHNGNEDPNCPACKEILRKAGVEKQ